MKVDEFIDALTKKGYVKLGAGHFSQVFARPNDSKVIKVSRHFTGTDGWVLWSLYCRANPTPMAPEYGKMKIGGSQMAPFYYCSMPRLSKLSTDVDARRKDELEGFMLGSLDRASADERAWMLKFREDVIIKYLPRMDTHSANFMVGKDGVVITDPLAQVDRDNFKQAVKDLRLM